VELNVHRDKGKKIRP